MVEKDLVREAVEAERVRLAASAIANILRVDPGPWTEEELIRATLAKAEFGTGAVRAAVSDFREAKVLVVNPPQQLIFNEEALSNL